LMSATYTALVRKRRGNNVNKATLSFSTSLFAFFLVSSALAQENASNPLSKGRNTDLRIQSTTGDGKDKTDYFIDGAFMARDDLKIKYELHYNDISSSETSAGGLEKAVLKGIFFPTEGRLNENWGYRLAVGLDWIVEFDNYDKGIGTGSDQLAPFAGVALGHANNGLTLIPLVQHYVSYDGPTDVSQTAMRLIGLQPFATDYWAKLDLKVPYDWNAKTWPSTAEFQVGYNLSDRVALYGEALVGIGSDRPYDNGIGVGLRLKY
ncbi:hypothetical protein R3X27_25135, partial [Tropicimonas sp. TH_r6]|uniref:hypothetical protein n=1 Tax=Tropicimonas sp. TH_r6 TaxID=3082085 RepID=UPI002953C21C